MLLKEEPFDDHKVPSTTQCSRKECCYRLRCFEDVTELFDIGCDGQVANKNEFNYESSPESKHVGIKTAE